VALSREFRRVPLTYLVARGPQLARNYLRVLEQARADYGDALEIRVGKLQRRMVSDPAQVDAFLRVKASSFRKSDTYALLRRLLGDSVLTTDGATWSKLRREINPEFTPALVESYVPRMVKTIDESVDRWGDAPVFDASEEMGRLGLRLIGESFLGFRGEGDAEAVTSAMSEGSKAALAGFLSPLPEKLWPFPKKRLLAAFAGLEAALERTLPAVSEGKPSPFFERLKARSTDLGAETLGRLRKQALSVFLAGNETTGLTLAWFWHLLSVHPEVAARVDEEVRGVIGSAEPHAEDLSKLVYTWRALQETMRLFPAISTVSRNALTDVDLLGLPVREGDFVMASPWVVHRHPDYWPHAERFDPERFAPGRTPVEGSYFPFGLGPRACVGAGFARVQMLATVARILQRFQLVSAAAPRVEPRPTVSPKPSLPLRVAWKAR
jgi:cytochrome P450